jgi:carbon-monoxide dehydrogenase large subunit
VLLRAIAISDDRLQAHPIGWRNGDGNSFAHDRPSHETKRSETEQIELADGCARAPDGRSLAFAELAADGLRVTTAFGNDNRLTYTYGSAAAHVAVDPGTGDVELLDCLVVEDVGRIVNPLTLHGQAMGGLVQGLGGAFLEYLVYDANGQLLAGNLADYLIPTASDFPNIRAIAIQNYRSPSNPLGVNGASEGAIMPIGGLMANAVGNALVSFGAMPNQLPLSPARVWHMSSVK